MKHELVLYHYWRSSCSWRVRWALAHKGVDYRSVPVNILQGEHKTPAYLAKNPTGFLPCLEVDGQFYGESLALCEWIDETWQDPPLLPTEPLARLRARQLALTIATGTQPLQNPSLLAHFCPDADQREPHARHFIERGLGIYEKLLAAFGESGPYSCGAKVSLADLCLIPQVYNALRFKVDLAAFPTVQRIYDSCLKLPACDQAAPHRQAGAH